jgi:hypothetical protein
MANFMARSREKNGAGDEIRTRDINLGKVALYQLSYSRVHSSMPHHPSQCQMHEVFPHKDNISRQLLDFDTPFRFSL